MFLKLTGAAGLALVTGSNATAATQGRRPLDRPALARSHNPRFSRFDPFAALSLGQGEFAFRADITGLQTFAAACETDFRVCTAAH
jgi:hypothetical protein